MNVRGAWRLEAFRETTSSGEVREPFGKHPRGLLLYTHDGFMSAQLMAPPTAHIDAHDIFGLPDAEAAAAARGYVAYSGPYRLVPGGIEHDLDVALFPGWLGTRQVRGAILEGRSLRLSTMTPYISRGAEVTAQLDWLRATSHSRSTTDVCEPPHEFPRDVVIAGL
ncbi:lipocalin-like domain-containing protein [Microbacterium trichothecenolyticum]|uniref:lipocalin-like domain-containing protein n=1 Tax=Microbacterium trichothecenolyticum TaxID=69370 RepID=UPI001C6E8E57|nr:lipocalin-like domain-containing protein [Microbacterium trichothecenolyticum]MBW9121932.1 lipocalin-like domain-containing protein [Microbacterium trichothecenolyticum]